MADEAEIATLPWDHPRMIDWLNKISVRRATNEWQVRIDPANVHRVPWPWMTTSGTLTGCDQSASHG